MECDPAVGDCWGKHVVSSLPETTSSGTHRGMPYHGQDGSVG